MPEGVKMIRVGGNRVGIIGLEEVLAELKAEGIQGDDRLKTELVQRVKKRNYIPPPVENDYADALLDEYKVFLGMAVERGTHLEKLSCLTCHVPQKVVKAALVQDSTVNSLYSIWYGLKSEGREGLGQVLMQDI